MKSGNLNFLEPSGHVHACNRTVLPLVLVIVLVLELALVIFFWTKILFVSDHTIPIQSYLSITPNASIVSILWFTIHNQDFIDIIQKYLRLISASNATCRTLKPSGKEFFFLFKPTSF